MKTITVTTPTGGKYTIPSSDVHHLVNLDPLSRPGRNPRPHVPLCTVVLNDGTRLRVLDSFDTVFAALSNESNHSHTLFLAVIPVILLLAAIFAVFNT